MAGRQARRSIADCTGARARQHHVRCRSADGRIRVAIDYVGRIYNGFVEDTTHYPDGYDCTVEATLLPRGSLNFFHQGSLPFATVLGAEGPSVVTGGRCQTDEDHSFDDTGGVFLGSATVRAWVVGNPSIAARIAAVVNDAEVAGHSSASYGGIVVAAAASRLISPLSRVDYYGYTTGTQVQNAGPDPVTVTGTYVTSDRHSMQATAPAPETVTLNPGASHTFWVAPAPATRGWLGSLRIEANDPSGLLVGITNDAPTAGGTMGSGIFNLVAMP